MANHLLKVIGYSDAAATLLDAAGVTEAKRDEGVLALGNKPKAFLAAAKEHRIWAREPSVRMIP
jgi:hypothetical protein